jgi:hypothetical protein
MADEKQVEVLRAEPAQIDQSREPPVVARLVVEIRSDGSRTIARGAIQDASLGQEVAVRAEGTTPLSLALSLVKAMVKAPFLGTAFGGAIKALTGKKR